MQHSVSFWRKFNSQLIECFQEGIQLWAMTWKEYSRVNNSMLMIPELNDTVAFRTRHFVVKWADKSLLMKCPVLWKSQF